MSLPRFFLDEQILVREVRSEFPLDLRAEDVRHARVLRVQPKEHIAVVDAASDYFECEVVSFDRDGLTVRIAQHENYPGPSHDVTLVQGIAKGDKMDGIVRHTTELGVSRIIPLDCERAVAKISADKLDKRMQRWGSIARSAAMQSGRLSIPEICAPLKVSGLKDALVDMDAVLVCWEEAQDSIGIGAALSDMPRDAKVAVVVGPEGGLAQDEVEMLLSGISGSHLVSLGHTILRTETAAIVASALVMYELGGLGNAAR